MYRIKHLCCLIFLIGSFLSITAQERTTEAEIKIEEIYLIATQKSMLGKFDEAIELFDKLIEEDELNSIFFYELARAYQGKGDWDKAEDAIDKALKIEKTNEWIWLTKAQIAESKKDFLGAALAFQNIVPFRRDRDLYWRWFEALEKANKLTEAIKVLDEAESFLGLSAQWTDAKVETYLKLDKPKEALQELIKPTTVQPKNSDNWTRLGNYYLLVGDKKNALKSFQTVLELRPRDENAAFQVVVLGQNSKTDDVIGVLVMDERIPLDEKIKTLIPELQESLSKNDVDNLKKLKKYGDKLVSQYPEAAQAYSFRGDVNSILSMDAEAVKDYQNAIKWNRSVFEVWYQLLQSIKKTEDWGALSRFSMDAIDYYPNQPAPFLFYSISQSKLANLTEAEEYLQEAELLLTNNSPYKLDELVALTILEQAHGRIDEAIKRISPLIQNAAVNDASLFELYGDLLFDKGDKVGAKKQWEQAMNLGANPDRISAKLQTI